MFALILPIPLLPLLAEHRVGLFQVKQGTGRNPNDEGALQIELHSHDAPSAHFNLSTPG